MCCLYSNNRVMIMKWNNDPKPYCPFFKYHIILIYDSNCWLVTSRNSYFVTGDLIFIYLLSSWLICNNIIFLNWVGWSSLFSFYSNFYCGCKVSSLIVLHWFSRIIAQPPCFVVINEKCLILERLIKHIWIVYKYTTFSCFWSIFKF